MNPMEKLNIERNPTSENISYLVDNKNYLCQHEKLHPITARTGKYISETMYRDLLRKILQGSHRTITPQENEVLANKK